MGFPDDEAPPEPGEKELGTECFLGLCSLLKPGAVILVSTAGWPNESHPFHDALHETLVDDFLVLRRGCLAHHARAAGALIDLPFYEAPKHFRMPTHTETVILDECDLAVEYHGISPELRHATKLVSVLPTLEAYCDKPRSGPFWLLKKDRAGAQKALRASEMFRGRS